MFSHVPSVVYEDSPYGGRCPAVGANCALLRFGSVFGLAVATAVFTANGHLGTAASFAAGFRFALAVLAGLSLLGALPAVADRPALAETEELAS